MSAADAMIQRLRDSVLDPLLAPIAGKLAGIEPGATADQSNAEIVAAVEDQLGNSLWQNSGIFKLIEFRTITTPANTIDFAIPAGFTRLKLMLENLRSSDSANRAVDIKLKHSQAGGGVTAGYSAARLLYAMGTDRLDFTASGEFDIYSFGTSGSPPLIDGKSIYRSSDTAVGTSSVTTFYANNYPHDGIQLAAYSTTQITSGKMWIFGAVQ